MSPEAAANTAAVLETDMRDDYCTPIARFLSRATLHGRIVERTPRSDYL